MPICLSLALFEFLMRKSPCGSPFQFSRGSVHLNITLSMEVLEPRMNALLNCLTTWRLCLHISLPPQSTFYASRLCSRPNYFPFELRISWPDFFSQLLTQLSPGIARFSCPLILCMKLNFRRTMLVFSTAKFIEGFQFASSKRKLRLLRCFRFSLRRLRGV